jgi:hypothetical protein
MGPWLTDWFVCPGSRRPYTTAAICAAAMRLLSRCRSVLSGTFTRLGVLGQDVGDTPRGSLTKGRPPGAVGDA